MAYSERLVDAVAFAHRAHFDQERKGSGVPYLTHLLAVAALVGEYGGDEDQVIAALLHDAPEDQGGEATLDEIRAQFGERVAEIVWGCSDTVEDPKPPWKARKEAYIAYARETAPDVRLVAAADKLHNARATLRDLERHGEAIWERFSGGRDGTLWYYRSVHDALTTDWSHPILDELAAVVAALEEAAKT